MLFDFKAACVSWGDFRGAGRIASGLHRLYSLYLSALSVKRQTVRRSKGLYHKQKEFHPFVVWTGGAVQFNFGLIQAQPPFDSEEKRLELLTKLNDFVDKNLPKDAISKYPASSLAGLEKPSAMEKFKSTFDWFIEQVKAS